MRALFRNLFCFFLRAISEKEAPKTKGKNIHVGNSGIDGDEVGDWVGVVVRVGAGVCVVGLEVCAGVKNGVGDGDEVGIAEGDGVDV